MKNYIVYFLLFVANISIDAQQYMKRSNIQVGTSGTYIWELERSVQGKQFQEFTFAFNIATSVHRKVQVGINSMTIFHTDFNTSKFNRSNITGIFGQYSLYSTAKKNLFVELSANRGNYCTCDPTFPYTRKNLNYIGIGAGANIHLYKQFYLDLGFSNYNILNKFKEKYNFTQYIIGINYLINFKTTVRTF